MTGIDSKRQAALDKLFEVENELGLHYDQRTPMTKDEALKLCDYLECNDASMEAQCKAAAFIRKALAQPEQEPVAWQLWVGADTPPNAPMGWQFYNTYNSLRSAEVSARTINSYQQAPFAKVIPLYTTPPQRKPLTDDVILHLVETHVGAPSMAYPLDNNDWLQFARAIEAKLKEKNT